MLAAFLLFASAAPKFAGQRDAVESFTQIGWGQWFRYLTGVLDIAGAALLFVPRWTCYGAVVLACSVGLGTLISLTVLRGVPRKWCWCHSYSHCSPPY